MLGTTMPQRRPPVRNSRGRRLPIAARLFVGVGLPAAVVVVGLGLLAWGQVRGAVEQSLARELAAQARMAATSLSANAGSARVLLQGDEETRTYKRLVGRLRTIAEATGSVRVMLVGDDERVRADDQGVIALMAPAPRVPLDRDEFAQALAGTPKVGVPFTSDDGHRYLAAYARVPEPKDEESDAVPGIAMVLTLEAPAIALDAVDDVAKKIAALVLGAVLLVLVTAVVVARTITGPLSTLARGAEGLATGDLSTPIAVAAGDDEVAVLGGTLESMREALAERDAERQMMLAGIAHEIRNPLGGIELFSGLLEESIEEVDGPAPVKAEMGRQSARVRKELRYLTGVVNDFLAFARDTPVQREDTDVRALLDDVASLSRRAGSAAVDVEDDAAGAFPLDRGKIKQALLNLVDNALAATPPEGRVVMRAARAEGGLTLSVEDTGKGMTDEALARAFTPFFTTKEKGSGLGLPLVKKLARDHGGDAVITSQPGRGTRVTLRLRAG